MRSWSHSESAPAPILWLDAPVSRRSLLRGALLAAGSLTVPGLSAVASAYQHSEAAKDAIAESPLVYVSPLRSDGSESRCHGEVWYVADGPDLLVVTGAERWKARAVRKGLDRARLWVGDFGVWTSAGDSFKQAPSFLTRARIDTDAVVHARALASFGSKYPDGWDKWRPRFRDGLKDQSRVLIRYAATGA